ncbi:MAG: hypothetical protein Q9216_005348 [Gyalolechia sp. 2 TL-2023]
MSPFSEIEEKRAMVLYCDYDVTYEEVAIAISHQRVMDLPKEFLTFTTEVDTEAADVEDAYPVLAEGTHVHSAAGSPTKGNENVMHSLRQSKSWTASTVQAEVEAPNVREVEEFGWNAAKWTAATSAAPGVTANDVKILLFEMDYDSYLSSSLEADSSDKGEQKEQKERKEQEEKKKQEEQKEQEERKEQEEKKKQEEQEESNSVRRWFTTICQDYVSSKEQICLHEFKHYLQENSTEADLGFHSRQLAKQLESIMSQGFKAKYKWEESHSIIRGAIDLIRTYPPDELEECLNEFKYEDDVKLDFGDLEIGDLRDHFTSWTRSPSNQYVGSLDYEALKKRLEDGWPAKRPWRRRLVRIDHDDAAQEQRERLVRKESEESALQEWKGPPIVDGTIIEV